jgi:hypothetical protein
MSHLGILLCNWDTVLQFTILSSCQQRTTDSLEDDKVVPSCYGRYYLWYPCISARICNTDFSWCIPYHLIITNSLALPSVRLLLPCLSPHCLQPHITPCFCSCFMCKYVYACTYYIWGRNGVNIRGMNNWRIQDCNEMLPEKKERWRNKKSEKFWEQNRYPS